MKIQFIFAEQQSKYLKWRFLLLFYNVVNYFTLERLYFIRHEHFWMNFVQKLGL